MDYQVSARKYRPGTFAEVVGQPHVVRTLQNAIQRNRVAHAYVFSGMRGVGKTTVARILAKSLNCEQGPTIQPCDVCPSCREISTGHSVDVIEIDGASNTGVDDVRELRENVKFTPFRGAYRIYIIDEVHMLSTSAFNALLKTLEEPPSHVVFVFATTEVHKIPATILSRCQHFTFRRIPRADMLRQLRHVADHRGVHIEDRSLSAIVRASDGSMRDALSLLDQAIAFGGETVRYADVENLLGSIPDELVHQLVEAILAKATSRGITILAEALDQGYDVRILCREVVEQFRNLVIAALSPSPEQLGRLLELSPESIQTLHAYARQADPALLQECFTIFLRMAETLRGSAFPRFLFEAAIIRATRSFTPSDSSDKRDDTRSRAPHADTVSEASSLSSQRIDQTPAKPSRRSAHAQPRVHSPALSTAAIDHRQDGHKHQKEAESPERATRPNIALTAARQTPPATTLNWEAVMEHVLNEYPNIGAFLEMGTILRAGPDEVVIGFPQQDSIARARVDKPETRRLLTEICTKITGNPMPVKIVEIRDAQAAPPTIAQQVRQRQREEEAELIREVHSHPLVKHALALFGGDIVAVTRCSPKEAS